MSNFSFVVFLLFVIGGLFGLLTVLGKLFDSKRCVVCGKHGPAEYMQIQKMGKVKIGYVHQDCTATR